MATDGNPLSTAAAPLGPSAVFNHFLPCLQTMAGKDPYT